MLQFCPDMPEILLIYDQKCFVCDAYCRRAHVRAGAGVLQRIHARDASPVMAELNARRLDVDGGLVLKRGDRYYYGAEAIHELSLLSDRGNPFNWFTYQIFRSSRVSHVLYPILRSIHDWVSKILHRSKVNNLKVPNNDWF